MQGLCINNALGERLVADGAKRLTCSQALIRGHLGGVDYPMASIAGASPAIFGAL